MSAPAKAMPAHFDRNQQMRRAMLAKVHVARKELGLTEDDYRLALWEQTKEWSAGDCSEAQLKALLAHFERQGWKSRPRKPGGRRAADHPAARKARALWISLHHLGAIRNPSDKALEAFAARQLNVMALQWADQGQCYKLIEALKAIGARHGWDQSAADRTGEGAVRSLKIALLDAILAKLKTKGLAGADWRIEMAASRLAGFEVSDYGLFRLSLEQLDQIAGALGAKLRESGL